ncbi:hypothetical protein RSOLAG22IIIB_05732 [Rhizoctonia solani]|uniref:HMG box domain-containing protein n=1 Tax=Rhizoctonia solani TaxID=456999 RepID=A0A0K6G890_9AGAM|nr:hypothetical protein RSOLAG22IIIB_05732 [Rhizoctonia solani]
MCELLAAGVVSPKGNIKRPPSSVMLFRRARFSTLTEKSMNGRNVKLQPMPLMVKNDWRTSNTGKAEYNELAKHVRQEHNSRYPAYKYTPIPERKWKAINKDGKKTWFFEFLSLISTNIVHEHLGAKPTGLNIDEWIRDPANHMYVNDQILDEILRNTESAVNISSGSRVKRQPEEACLSNNAIQLHNNAYSINGLNTLRKRRNPIFPASQETMVHPQPSPHSSLSLDMSDGSSQSQLLYSTSLPFTKEVHETIQDHPSNPDNLPAIYCTPNSMKKQASFTPEGYKNLTDRTPPYIHEGIELTHNAELIAWGVNNVEGHNTYPPRVPYDMVQSHSTIAEFEALDYTPVSQLSNQSGVSDLCSTDSNGELTYNYSELMNEFPNPFVPD